MWSCDEQRFAPYHHFIQRIWDGRYRPLIEHWGRALLRLNSASWFFVGSTFIIFASQGGNSLSLKIYLYQDYCPSIGDCIIFAGKLIPVPWWFLFHIFAALLVTVGLIVFRQGYRKGKRCLAWWGNVIMVFSYMYLFATIGENGFFVAFAGQPIPTALVGYGMPVIYTIWFLSALLPSMRRLWRGECLDFRAQPLEWKPGTGGAAALLGILGVALGRLLSETPHGNWGYFAVSVIVVPWMMALAIRDGIQSLLTLAPWRIVLEIEALQKKVKEEKL
jgi:hypothetical protein